LNAPELTSEAETAVRERRCIVTGEILPDEKRVRFVADPQGNIVPDVAGTLPGRGLWVKADRDCVARAVGKNAFSKAAKAAVKADADLPDRVEQALVRRMVGDLGLARKAGALVFGFDNVVRALGERISPAVLIEASDGAPDGRRKIVNMAQTQGVSPKCVHNLSRAELALALGRENVIHAAVKPGRLAERLILEAARLEGFRRAARHAIGPMAPDEGYE